MLVFTSAFDILVKVMVVALLIFCFMMVRRLRLGSYRCGDEVNLLLILVVI